MFHRAPIISPAAVLTTALILLVGVLLALSLSPPSTANADHGGSLPQVSIVSITPEVGEEGGSLRVTLKLSRPLTADEKWCYPSVANAEPNDEVCIEGGIIIWDTYNDHIQVEENGFIPSDQLFAFKFRTDEMEKRLNPSIANDACITPGRTIRIAINTSFRSDTYGYTIDTEEHTVRIAGNDETNGESGRQRREMSAR